MIQAVILNHFIPKVDEDSVKMRVKLQGVDLNKMRCINMGDHVKQISPSTLNKREEVGWKRVSCEGKKGMSL